MEQPAAIVGMGCRLPGAPDLNGFWNLLREERHGIREVPEGRWDPDQFYDEDRRAPGKAVTKTAGFIEGIADFDWRAFGISPREARRMDPQHRLLLESAWEAIEDAGIPFETLAGSRTGVFMALQFKDYFRKQTRHLEDIDTYTATGNSFAFAANRISYQFDLHGPSITFDTGCSGSLTALHYACRSILGGESELAIVGGANALVSPETFVVKSKAGVLSPDGKCKTFDASADGYGQGEGGGVIVVKSLDRACEDGDRIYATIESTVLNSNGKNAWINTVDLQSEVDLLRRATKEADLEPAEIDYVELHGTGTQIGDKTEAQAVGSFLGNTEGREEPVRVGSAKTNVGHLESGGSVVHVIKTALSIWHETIPASLHMENLNPEIEPEALNIELQTSTGPWPDSGRERRYALVTSLSLGGANAETAMGSRPPDANGPKTRAPWAPTEILPISAKGEDALDEAIESWIDHLDRSDEDERVGLHDLLYTASVRRSHFSERMAVVGRSPQELSQNLEEYRAGPTNERGDFATGEVAFVFAGHGQQRARMAVDLYATSQVVRDVLDRCAEEISARAGWSLLEVLRRSEEENPFESTEVTQPAVVAVQIALSRLWRAFGVEPDVVVGHSLGEIAACEEAGILTLEEAMRLALQRGEVMAEAVGGRVMAVQAAPEAVQPILDGQSGQAVVAVRNSPNDCVISGTKEAVDAVEAALERREVGCFDVKLPFPSHSPLMEEFQPVLRDRLDWLEPNDSKLPIYSPMDGGRVEGSYYDAGFWSEQICNQISFSETVSRMATDGVAHFVEISANPVLLYPMKKCVSQDGNRRMFLPTIRENQEEKETFLSSLSECYELGFDIDWSELYPSGRVASLPTYPWQRSELWFESSVDLDSQSRDGGGDPVGENVELPGERIELAVDLDVEIWEIRINAKNTRYLEDHQIAGVQTVPGTLFIQLALIAANELYGQSAVSLSGIEFHDALQLKDVNYILQTALAETVGDEVHFSIYGRSVNDDEWTHHAEGTVQLAANA